MHTTDSGDVAPEVLPAVPTLVLLHSGDTPVAVGPPRRLDPGEMVVGRDVKGGHGLSLPDDRRLSRRHAAFVIDAPGQRPRVRDAGSKNGVLVNGRLVGAAGQSLDDGDLVRVGDSFLLFRLEPVRSLDAPIPALRGSSPAVRALRYMLRLAAPSPLTVLLLGESGVGKEVAARAVHEGSGRTGPFIAVNSSAIPTELAESQLFGHVAGAFTGARVGHEGFFRAAHGGTLFLDEVGDLAPALQPKLLRAIEERAVIPVGSTAAVPIDVRLVAATHRDLGRAIQDGTFRGDLHARLADVVLRLPPLRERREDILPLFAHALGAPAPRLSARLVEALLLHAWPYNVRELLKVASQLRLYAADPDRLDLDPIADRLGIAPAATAVSAAVAEPAPPGAATSTRPTIPTREELQSLMIAHRGNASRIAAQMGRSRRQVERWLEHHHIDAAEFRRRSRNPA